MKKLEDIAVPANHSLVYAEDKDTRQSYWGYDSSKKHIFIYNTKEPELVEHYIFQARMQYSLYE
jgi:hypothetical protein